MPNRSIARAVGGAALGAILAAVPLTAYADGSGSSTNPAYGKNVGVGVNIHGDGTYISYTTVKATNSASGQDPDFPNFVGCHVHAQLWNDSPHYRSWNTDTVDCSSFINDGWTFVINVNDYVPTANYCATLWIDSNGDNYQHGGVPCVNVY